MERGDQIQRGIFRRVLAAVFGPVQPLAVRPSTATPMCDPCGSTAVCPIDWEPDGEHDWWIATRCGECGAWAELSLSNDQAAQFDMQLSRQERLIAAAVEQLVRERFLREAEAFVEALRLDLIGPDDFRPSRVAS